MSPSSQSEGEGDRESGIPLTSDIIQSCRKVGLNSPQSKQSNELFSKHTVTQLQQYTMDQIERAFQK